MIKDKFQLKGGYGDLIANEEKYAEFVRTLGYEYYASYSELSKYYQDTSFQLDEKKLELCTTMYIITLEDKKIKNLSYWFSYSFIDTERDYRNYRQSATPHFVAKHTAR